MGLSLLDRLLFWISREFDGEGGPFTDFALHAEPPSMAFNNAIGGAET
jgi:hypothetical protein